jgi:hypothetical protein
VSVTLLAKWRLLQCIFANARLSQSAKVIAGILLDCLNTETERCDPSLTFLEARSGLKRRRICEVLEELREHDVLRQKRRRGTSTYRFNFGTDEVQESAPLARDEVLETARLQVQETAPLEVHKSAPPREIGNIETGKMKPGKISPAFAARPRSRLLEADLDAAFSEWWPHYPKKVDKHGARLAHGRVLKAGKATNAELIAGADRYAAQCAAAGTESRFIKGPERWLNAGCWADEPEAPYATNGATHPPKRNGRDDYRDALARFGAEPDKARNIEAEYSWLSE